MCALNLCVHVVDKTHAVHELYIKDNIRLEECSLICYCFISSKNEVACNPSNFGCGCILNSGGSKYWRQVIGKFLLSTCTCTSKQPPVYQVEMFAVFVYMGNLNSATPVAVAALVAQLVRALPRMQKVVGLIPTQDSSFFFEDDCLGI